MFPPTYTLTVLILTLLQFSLDKPYQACIDDQLQNGTSAECPVAVHRKEIRALDDKELSTFVDVFNDYLVNNASAEWNEAEPTGVTQVFDKLLHEYHYATPYWDYRIDMNLDNVSSSALWDDPRLKKAKNTDDAQWLAEFVNNDLSEEDFFEDPGAQLKKQRNRAVQYIQASTGTNILWHLLLLVTIEGGYDHGEPMNKTTCATLHGVRWKKSACTSLIASGSECDQNKECLSNFCSTGTCSTETKAEPTGPHQQSGGKEDSLKAPRLFPPTMSTPIQSQLSTEFLAKELDPAKFLTSSKTWSIHNHKTKPKKSKGRHKKPAKSKTTTTKPPPQLSTLPTFMDQIPPLPYTAIPTNPMTYNINETNTPIDPERYEPDTLDALLVYMPTPKVPVGMISWTNQMPFRMAYFSFAIVEGSFRRSGKLKEKSAKRAKGARIYVKGLDMPAGYRQITQGKQLRHGIGALARTLHPDNNGPFVEFKMRVENRYGVPCKQMCLDSHQRYRRCARRTVRLSPYKRFGDPITYYNSEQRAIEGQWTGKGYYRKRKLSYLLFKCE